MVYWCCMILFWFQAHVWSGIQRRAGLDLRVWQCADERRGWTLTTLGRCMYIYVFCNNSPSLVVFCAESGACSTLYGTLNMFSPVGQITIAREQALIRGEIIHGQFGHVQFVESKHDRALDPGPWPRAGRPQRIQEHLLCVCGSRLNCTPVRQRVENFVQEELEIQLGPVLLPGNGMFNHV